MMEPETIASFSWQDVAAYCPELLVDAWKTLEWEDGNAEFFPILAKCEVLENGEVKAVCVFYTTKNWTIAKKGLPLTRRFYPFGREESAAARAKEYVDKKKVEIAAERKKRDADAADFRQSIRGLLGK